MKTAAQLAEIFSDLSNQHTDLCLSWKDCSDRIKEGRIAGMQAAINAFFSSVEGVPSAEEFYDVWRTGNEMPLYKSRINSIHNLFLAHIAKRDQRIAELEVNAQLYTESISAKVIRELEAKLEAVATLPKDCQEVLSRWQDDITAKGCTGDCRTLGSCIRELSAILNPPANSSVCGHPECEGVVCERRMVEPVLEAPVDPYADLKAAAARGEWIQLKDRRSGDWCWPKENHNWTFPVEDYRVLTTIKHGGKTFFTHTPGNEMPCGSEVHVVALLKNNETRINYARNINWSSPQHDVWPKLKEGYEVVGWHPLTLAEALGNVEKPQESKHEWHEGKTVQFDQTVMLGKGYDFEGLELRSEELRLPNGRILLVWPDRVGGKAKWSLYDSIDGGMWFEQFASADEAKAKAEEVLATETLTPVEKPKEQEAFERWLAKTSPSGDATAVRQQWQDSSDYRELFEEKPEERRQPPAGLVLHNPDHLTPEQVGADHRLPTTIERCVGKLQQWTGDAWRDVEMGGTMSFGECWSTYRVPITTPWPEVPPVAVNETQGDVMSVVLMLGEEKKRANELERSRDDWKASHDSIKRQADAKIEELMRKNRTLADRGMEMERKVPDLEQKIYALETRLAALTPRPVSVKPTKEDGDAGGRITAFTGSGVIWTQSWDREFSPSVTHWLPGNLCPDLLPIEDKEREEFIEKFKDTFNMESKDGEFRQPETHCAWMGWQARAGKE